MRMKLNQKCASGASTSGVIDRKLLRDIANQADDLAIDISNALCAADLAFRHAQDSEILDGTGDGKGNEIYFPPHERAILGFIMQDVSDRLLKLDKVASDLSISLMGVLEMLREAEKGCEK